MHDGFGSDIIDSILDEALRCARSGEDVKVDRYCEAHPELADEIRLLLPAMLLLERPTAKREQPIPASLLGLKDYEILREIGRGAMGVVYEAFQKSLRRKVALKAIKLADFDDSVPLQRFLREAAAAASLQHSNIVTVYSADQSDEFAFYSMEFVDGLNLQQLLAGKQFGKQFDKHADKYAEDQFTPPDPEADLRSVQTKTSSKGSTKANFKTSNSTTSATTGSTNREPSLVEGSSKQEPLDAVEDHASGTSEEFRGQQIKDSDRTNAQWSNSALHSPVFCAKVALQVAKGLEYAHEHGVIHRDIKPSNIILDRTGHTWIADFGLARVDGSQDLTRTGEIVGTLRYLAPECFSGVCDVRSDIYSLGITLFEMLEGQPAFLHHDRAKLMHQILSGPIPEFTVEIPSDLRTICQACIGKDPQDRYVSAQALAEDLTLFLAGKPILARPARLLHRTLRWARSNLVVSTLLSILLLTSCGYISATWIMAQRHQRLVQESQHNFVVAQQKLALVLTSVDQLRKTMEDDLKMDHPELKKLHSQLLDTAVKYNQQFIHLPGVADDAKRQLASVYLRLGLLGGSSDNLEQQREYLKKAKALLEEHDSRLSDPEIAMDLVRCETGMGGVALRADQFSLTEESLKKAITLATELTDRLPIDSPKLSSIRVLKVKAINLLATAYVNEMKYEHVEQLYLDAIQLLMADPGAVSPDSESSAELANTWLALGEYYLTNIRLWKKANEPFLQASEIYEKILFDKVDRPEVKSKYSRLLLQRAKLAFMGNDRSQAIDFQQRAVDSFSALVESQPTIRGYQAELSIGLRRLGEYVGASIPFDPRAFDILDRAIDIQLRIVERDATDIVAKISLVKCYEVQGSLFASEKRNLLASTKYDQAVEILDRILENQPNPKAQEQRNILAICRANLWTSLGNFDLALDEWDTAIRYSSPEMTQYTQMLRTRTQVASGDIQGGVAAAEALLPTNQPNQAVNIHLYREALRTFAIASKLLAEQPTNPERIALSETYARKAVELTRQMLLYPNRFTIFLSTCEDLDCLRDRPDFSEIMGQHMQRVGSTNSATNSGK